MYSTTPQILHHKTLREDMFGVFGLWQIGLLFRSLFFCYVVLPPSIYQSHLRVVYSDQEKN